MQPYLSDKQLLQLCALMYYHPDIKYKIKLLLKDNRFIQYNSKEIRILYDAILNDKKEIIMEYSKIIPSINGLDIHAFIKLVAIKYASYKWSKLLPFLLKPKDTEEDIRELKRALERYTYNIALLDTPLFEREITKENINKISTLDELHKYKTTYTQLDDCIGGGVYAGRMYVFLGGTGSGKSTILRSLAINFALQKIKTLYITLEMSAVEVANLIKHAFNDKINDIFNHLVVVEDLDCDFSMLSSILAIHKPQILIIDYIDEYSTTDWKYMSNIIRDLRYYSKIYNIPVITASQLSRMGYNEVLPDDIKLATIAGSFEKVKKAEYVGLIDIKNNLFTIKTLKNRWGPLNTIKLTFNSNILYIEEINNE